MSAAISAARRYCLPPLIFGTLANGGGLTEVSALGSLDAPRTQAPDLVRGLAFPTRPEKAFSTLWPNMAEGLTIRE